MANVVAICGSLRKGSFNRQLMNASIGLAPADGSLNTEGLDLSPEALRELLSVDADALKAELTQVREHLARFGDRLPEPIRKHFEALEAKLS